MIYEKDCSVGACLDSEYDIGMSNSQQLKTHNDNLVICAMSREEDVEECDQPRRFGKDAQQHVDSSGGQE